MHDHTVILISSGPTCNHRGYLFYETVPSSKRLKMSMAVSQDLEYCAQVYIINATTEF